MADRLLYQSALDFKKVKLWQRVYDSQIFAVEYADGAVGYVSVMGMLGEHFALAVYMGARGIQSYYQMLEEDANKEPFVLPESVLKQNCLMCSFENLEELEKADRAEIKALELKIRGRGAYPLFRRYSPRREAWFLRDEAEQERLRIALMAALELSGRVNQSGELDWTEECDFSPDIYPCKRVPLLRVVEGGERPTFCWVQTQLPDFEPEAYKPAVLADELALARLKRIKVNRNVSLACATMLLPTGIGDPKVNAPVYPFLMLMLDLESELVFPPLITQQFEGVETDLLEQFLALMAEGGLPGRIYACDRRTYALFEWLAKQTGLKLELQEDCPEMAEAMGSLLSHLLGGGEAL